MAGNVEFINNTITVKNALRDVALQFLEEAGAEVESQAVRNTPRDTGQMAGDWQHPVNSAELLVTIGNSSEHSIWQEMGTGEYALNGDGRKGGWRYVDAFGKGHFTMGNRPRRMLYNAWLTTKAAIISRAESLFGGVGS